jgi:hypothetical protein
MPQHCIMPHYAVRGAAQFPTVVQGELEDNVLQVCHRWKPLLDVHRGHQDIEINGLCEQPWQTARAISACCIYAQLLQVLDAVRALGNGICNLVYAGCRQRQNSAMSSILQAQSIPAHKHRHTDGHIKKAVLADQDSSAHLKG